MTSPAFLSVSDAASDLRLHESRVRALLQAGRLEGVKLGGRWLVDGRSVWRRKRAGASRGRHLRPRNAWGLLALASGEQAPWLSPGERYRMRCLLDNNALHALRPRLDERATVHRFQAHAGVLRRLGMHGRLVLTGASAASARGLELVAGRELDAYAPYGEVDDLIRRFALSPADDESNVVLREMPAELWPFEERHAPVAAVAVDLGEYGDARSADVAERALAKLSSARAWRVER
ncbi:MAG TPA: helix-turn-helix domain-containing protein [Solirubrobacteraceae bacterium]|nr:helix-turn-helix domain-containing protein [Solirubrobacteraceae bacterium]